MLANKSEIASVIANRKPLGHFAYYDSEKKLWIGVDNQGGEALVEEFESAKECATWLGLQAVRPRAGRAVVEKLGFAAACNWGLQLTSGEVNDLHQVLEDFKNRGNDADPDMVQRGEG